ncbi:CHAT domain-containing protein [Streptomyces sp. AD681]|uniref:CHAT domain-containing protein n=1 Tax=Streptomyces sp. AD681 TaxID=3019069 RepID=UPI003FA6F32C
MTDRFDLESLMRSVKAVTGDRPWSTAIGQLGTLVAEHAATADAAAAFELYYAHWRSMPGTDPRRPGFAGYLLQLVPLMRQSGPCCTLEQAQELAAAARTVRDPQWQAYITGALALVVVNDTAATNTDPELLEKAVEDVSSRGYDEAYSLATAFLTAGAHTVLGTLWPVPDEETSLLMYMTHHYLRREALPPGQALRRAQLWMLDPQRRVPPEMPARLAVRARYIRSANLVGWAGFTHQGW